MRKKNNKHFKQTRLIPVEVKGLPNHVRVGYKDIKIKYEYDAEIGIFTGKSYFNSKNFVNKFDQNLRSFPFDKQLLKLRLEEVSDVSSKDYFLLLSGSAKYNLAKNINNIKSGSDKKPSLKIFNILKIFSRFF